MNKIDISTFISDDEMKTLLTQSSPAFRGKSFDRNIIKIIKKEITFTSKQRCFAVKFNGFRRV